jgi:hypothetical protein
LQIMNLKRCGRKWSWRSWRYLTWRGYSKQRRASARIFCVSAKFRTWLLPNTSQKRYSLKLVRQNIWKNVGFFFV